MENDNANPTSPVPAPAPSKAVSYKHIFGRELVPPDGVAEPFDGPPKNDKDYGVYRDYYENMMSDMMQNQGVLGISVNCEDKDKRGNPHKVAGQKKEHFGCFWVFACHHTIHQDPVNPEGCYFIPFKRDEQFGYFLCKTCMSLLERKKLDIYTVVCMKCGLCVQESVDKIIQKDPSRYKDLRLIK